MDANKEHPVSLRVMRLTKPSLLSSFPIPVEDHDFVSITPGQSNKVLPNLGSGELLMLPQSFGNIFLGETFISYLSVNNESSMDVASVSIKADLQTGSQRMSLTSTEPIPCLSPGQALDEIIHHEVKELGTHILAVIVSYKRPDGEFKSFRKFFKFQVLKPIEVKNKFINITCDKFFLEMQIQNLTQSPICLDHVHLEPTQMYTATALNTTPDNRSIFGANSYLKPTEMWQYLYMVEMKPDWRRQRYSDSALAIGKLDIEWKSSLGEKGRLQTNQLQRTAFTIPLDLRLQVEVAPNEVTLNQPFCVNCSITNHSERPMDLTLNYENTSDILWQGVSGAKLKRLSSKSSLEIELKLLPISPGLQSISGLRLVDSELNRTYNYDDIHHVHVVVN